MCFLVNFAKLLRTPEPEFQTLEDKIVSTINVCVISYSPA